MVLLKANEEKRTKCYVCITQASYDTENPKF